MPNFQDGDWIRGKPALSSEPCEERPHNISKQVTLLTDAIANLRQALDELYQDLHPVCRPVVKADDNNKIPAPPIQSELAGKLEELVDIVISLNLEVNGIRRRIDL